MSLLDRLGLGGGSENSPPPGTTPQGSVMVEPGGKPPAPLLGGLADAAQNAATGALVNSAPGAGVLFEYDLEDGFMLTRLGTMIALGLAAYGALRLISK